MQFLRLHLTWNPSGTPHKNPGGDDGTSTCTGTSGGTRYLGIFSFGLGQGGVECRVGKKCGSDPPVIPTLPQLQVAMYCVKPAAGRARHLQTQSPSWLQSSDLAKPNTVGKVAHERLWSCTD